jgi:hypothetical protein
MLLLDLYKFLAFENNMIIFVETGLCFINFLIDRLTVPSKDKRNIKIENIRFYSRNKPYI